MTIEEVIDAAIVAVYTSPKLSKHLVLKGGAGLRLFEGHQDRTSIDADFSVSGSLEAPKEFYAEVKQSTTVYYDHLGYEVIDFKYQRKPKTKRRDRPEWWGWLGV